MSFVRYMLLEKEKHDTDKIVTRRKIDALKSTKHKRIYFVLPDISGTPQSVKYITEKLHRQLPDSPCKLIRKNCNAPKTINPKSFQCNAAYVRYNDQIIYFNDKLGQITPINERYRSGFDEKLEIHNLDYDTEYELSNEDLSNIVLKTTHIHERKTPILFYTDPKISEGVYKNEVGFGLVQQEHSDIWTLMQQYDVERPFIVGYSYSSVLAIEIMQHVFLNKYNKKIDAVIVDAPTPNVSKKFFENQTTEPGKYLNTLQYVESILSVVNYCAKVCELPSIELDKETKAHLQTFPPEQCVQEIARLIIGDRTDCELFESTTSLAQKRLLHLAKFEKEEKIDRKDVDLTIILTDETQEKYKEFSPDTVCGWKKFAKKMHIIGYDQDENGNYFKNPKNELEEDLLATKHQSLSQKADKAELVATVIVESSNRIDEEIENEKENAPLFKSLPPVSEIIELSQAVNQVAHKRQQVNSPGGSPAGEAHRLFQRKKQLANGPTPVTLALPRYVSPLKSGGT